MSKYTASIDSMNWQESILLRLAWNDDDARMLSDVLQAHHFDDPRYRYLAEVLFDYVREHKRAPKKALPHIVEEFVKRKDDKHVEKLLDAALITMMFEHQDDVPRRDFYDFIAKFAAVEGVKEALMEACDVIQENGGATAAEQVDAADRAVAIVSQARKNRAETFQPGVLFNDPKRPLAFLNRDEDDVFPTGIPALDRFNAGPIRGGLHLFVAPAKRGKSWWLVHLGRMARLLRHNVVHISLEMDETYVDQRYNQAINRASLSRVTSDLVVLGADDHGVLNGFTRRASRNKHNLAEDGIAKVLRKTLENGADRAGQLVIKAFPTRKLTVAQLESYLDMLADVHSIIPDLLIIDYLDIMTIGGRVENHRTALGRLYEDVRGLAMERKVAIATATQSNREGIRTGTTHDYNIAEDISKLFTADTILTYSRTADERRNNIARLNIAAMRGNQDNVGILLSQHYDTGQFHVSSALIDSRSEDVLKHICDGAEEHPPTTAR